MDKENVISDEALRSIEKELANNQNWLAYNTISYFLQKEDVYGFKHKEEAHEFAANNISEYDSFRVIYARSVADVFRQIHYGETLENTLTQSTVKSNVMEKDNAQYLKDQVKYHGFGDKLNEQLEQHLNKGSKEFTLQYTKNDGKLEAALHFKQSEKNEKVYFNSYEAKLTNAQGEERSQQFYLNKGKGVTLVEAQNLLEGRSVFKELTSKENQPYKAWLQLNFEEPKEKGNYKVNTYHQGYGYDLEKNLQKLPLKLENEEAKERLVKNLQRGNITLVTFRENGQEKKMHLEASPQYKNIIVYNQDMKREFQQHKEQRQKQQQERKHDRQHAQAR